MLTQAAVRWRRHHRGAVAGPANRKQFAPLPPLLTQSTITKCGTFARDSRRAMVRVLPRVRCDAVFKHDGWRVARAAGLQVLVEVCPDFPVRPPRVRLGIVKPHCTELVLDAHGTAGIAVCMQRRFYPLCTLLLPNCAPLRGLPCRTLSMI